MGAVLEAEVGVLVQVLVAALVAALVLVLALVALKNQDFMKML